MDIKTIREILELVYKICRWIVGKAIPNPPAPPEHVSKLADYLAGMQDTPVVPRWQFSGSYRVQPSDFKNVEFGLVRGSGQRREKITMAQFRKGVLSGRKSSSLVIGEAGIGKTTFCKWLSKEIARGNKLGSNKCLQVPVLISLTAFCVENTGALDDTAVPALGGLTFRQLAELGAVKKHTLFLILDGLNEIAPEECKKMLSQVDGFRERYGVRTHIILTSRSAGVSQTLLSQLEEFAVFELQRWTEEQLSSYLVANGYHASRLEELSREMRNSLRLPLLAFLYLRARGKGNGEVSLQTVNDVYQWHVDNSLKGGHQGEHTNSAKHPVSLEKRRTALAKFAYTMTADGVVVTKFIELENCLPSIYRSTFGRIAGELLDAGLLRPSDGPSLDPTLPAATLRARAIMFIHQSFQEYLTAVHLHNHPKLAPGLPPDPSTHFMWRDVPIYMLRLIDQHNERGQCQAVEFVTALIEKPKPDFWTAARLVNEVAAPNRETVRKDIIRGLFDSLKAPLPYANAVDAFRELGDYGRDKLLDSIKNSEEVLRTAVPLPEWRLAAVEAGRLENVREAEKTPDSDGPWRSLARPIYVLGELGEAKLIDLLLTQLSQIKSIHLQYHVFEAYISIVKSTGCEKALGKLLQNEIKRGHWLSYGNAVVEAYAVALLKALGRSMPSRRTISLVLTRLDDILRKSARDTGSKYQDAFWVRAHGIDVCCEITDNPEGAIDLLHLIFSAEDKAVYDESNVQGFKEVQSSVLKGCIRLRNRSLVTFTQIQAILETATQSERLAANRWGSKFLEDLLTGICTEKELPWLKSRLSHSEVPGATQAVIRNVIHAQGMIKGEIQEIQEIQGQTTN